MAKYDKEIGKQYLKNCDFLSLSDYLYASTPENPLNRRKMDEDAAYFRKLGEYATTMFNRSNDKERTALYLQSITGVYNPENKYVKALHNSINSITSNDGTNLNSFLYEFDDDEAYSKFMNNFSEDNYDDFVDHAYITGKHYVRLDKRIFDKDLTKAIQFMTALNESNHLERMSIKNNKQGTPWSKSNSSVNRKGTPWSKNQNQNSNVRLTPWDQFVSTPSYSSTSEVKNKEGKLLQDSYSIRGMHPKLKNAFANFSTNLAAEQLKMASYNILPNLDKIQEGDAVTLTNLVYTGYMCEAEAKLKKGKLYGTVNKEYANDILKDIDDYYKNILSNIDLNNPQYSELYASELNGETTNLKAVGNEDNQRTILTALIKQGIKNNRISYVSGIAGGRSGTVINITPETDNDGNPINNLKSGVTMFIPGLFEEDIAKVQSNNSGIKAFQEYNDRVSYNYNYNTSFDGTISDFTDDSALITKDGMSSRYSREEIQKIIEKDILLRNASRLIQRSTVDDKGEYIGISDKTKDMAKVAATNIAETIYGDIKDAYPAEYEAEYQQILRYFAGLLGYNLN